MFKKKFNEELANKFNNKKTKQDDLFRFKNIHKKINHNVSIVKQNVVSTNKREQKLEHNIYNFNKIQPSVNINLDILRDEEYFKKIPKIQLKEIPIPSYSDNDNFDLNKINQNISTPIHMDLFASDVINDVDITRLKNKKINKIIHIYQEKYAHNVTPTGFGDFIRSCFFIIQFCQKYDFKYEIIINHPIAEFLQKYSSKYNNCNAFYKNALSNKISMFTDTNWDKSIFDNEGKNYIEDFSLIKEKLALFVNYLSQLPTTISRSVISYNILFPYDVISYHEKNILRSLFEPSEEMKLYIDETLNKLSVTKKNFLVLHIRSGDSYLKNENKIFDTVYFEIIKNEIIEIIFKNKETDILLIADNNEIKILLKPLFPKIKFIVNKITHIGEGVELDSVKVKNTLLDFYIMSNSSYIYSLTCYPHGSGFSYWCSKLYDIPYKCKYVDFS